jgi:hypothetical protein
MASRATASGAEAATYAPPPCDVEVPIVNGIATFDCCTITQARSGYVLTVSGQQLPPLSTPAFSVVPGVPSQIFKYPDGTITKPAGQRISNFVRVRVKDAFLNPIDGLTVAWSTSTAGASITGATSVTNGDGFAGLESWTLAPGDNVLTATVVGYPSLVATFKGKGTTH